jgi:aminopeptidase N
MAATIQAIAASTYGTLRARPRSATIRYFPLPTTPMPKRNRLHAALSACLFTAALLAAAPASFAQVREDNEFLSQQAAAARSARVSNVAYTLDFALTGEPTFSATSSIEFDLSDNAQPLTVDLDKAQIRKLSVNGRELQPQYNQWFITIPASALKPGRNSIRVEFTREHSTTGEGLHRYVDKADGRVYLYSHFEPAAAHQMFASFDQPDLKATYTLTATAPKDWVVVSTTRETSIDDLGAMKRWHFPATPKLSPYNFSMHAGPYKVWEDDSGKYPMRLLARQSLADQVAPADWFRYTKNGLAYYDEYFGVAYPFKKYDQILVPQFIYGAMENAGAVTFAEESFTSHTAMTAVERQELASTILHEMSHQWFGDLVTMRWWNGLWLNESFASYMATLGSAKSGEFKQPWLAQYRSKQGAYRTDSSLATHPIEVPVPSTANAFDNIDAITYTKGASVLHQLRAQIGEETFRRGVHDYLVKYSYQNATLDDFIESLAKAAGRDLKPWAQEWLYQPGVNTLAADFECRDGKVSRFALKQGVANPAWPTLREQLVQVALFDVAGDKLVLSDKLPVTYRGASTDVPALVGKACPALVYPNYEDWGFAKVTLDSRSFDSARQHLTHTDDVLLRSMLWQSLSDGLREQRVALPDYLDALLTNAPLEPEYNLVRQALMGIDAGQDMLQTYGPANAATRKYAAATSRRMEDTLWAGMLANAGERDKAKYWFNTYVGVASTQAGLANLRAVLDGKARADGVEIDQELRWSIVERLNRFDAPGSEALIAAELARDGSESGQLSAIAAAAGRPDPKAKAEWLAKIQALPTKELPYAKLRVAMRSLFPAGQEALAEASTEQRLATLAKIEASADRVFMRSYGGNMLAGTCTAASVARLQKASQSTAGLSEGVRRDLLSALEDDQRCLANRAKFEGALHD